VEPTLSERQILFTNEWRKMLEQTPNVEFWQDMVKEIIVHDGTAIGLITGMGMRIMAKR